MQSYGTLFMTGSITSRPVNVNCTETSATYVGPLWYLL